jgi:peptidoglycan/LPS O-acetylase OafA/YrhL
MCRLRAPHARPASPSRAVGRRPSHPRPRGHRRRYDAAVRAAVRIALVVVGLALLVGATAPFTNLWPEPGWWAVPHQEVPDKLADEAYREGRIRGGNGKYWEPRPSPYDPLDYWLLITIGGITLGGFLLVAGASPRLVFVDRTRPNVEAARERRQRGRSGRRPIRPGLALAGVGVMTFGAASIPGRWPGVPMAWWIASALIALGLWMLVVALRPARTWDVPRRRLATRAEGPSTAPGEPGRS